MIFTINAQNDLKKGFLEKLNILNILVNLVTLTLS